MIAARGRHDLAEAGISGACAARVDAQLKAIHKRHPRPRRDLARALFLIAVSVLANYDLCHIRQLTVKGVVFDKALFS